ncbi:hypothetical protein BD310DRAFT_914910 [Dichomitus squalens]|uniref:Uncharacterized protein n=1 Tax=Dichomitus squalens TaxID=114155 RepID=A0A4Q9QAB6_9APHY|nr:hypothetical protein BD310DRAFT_914910 [Dichomitus squalens]
MHHIPSTVLQALHQHPCPRCFIPQVPHPALLSCQTLFSVFGIYQYESRRLKRNSSSILMMKGKLCHCLHQCPHTDAA